MVFSGSGGQGVITAAIILAEAAVLYENLTAVQSQSYGPEARGGASKSEVVIDDGIIHYPKVRQADVVLALTDEAFLKYAARAKEGALVIADLDVREESVAEVGRGLRVLRLPIVKTAREDVGRSQTTNIVALGVLNAYARLVADEALEAAVLARVPRGTEDMNRKALVAGRELGSRNEA